MPKHAETGPKPKRLGLAFAAIAVALASLMCLTAQTALAADSTVIAYSVDAQGNKTNYYTISEAVRAGYADENRVIVIASDWESNNTIDIDDSKHVTIDMNGHRITNTGGGRVFHLYEKAHLTLKSTNTTKFIYSPYSEQDGCQKGGQTIETGGLVTGANTGDDGGGIWAENWTTLTLDNVAVAGNQAANGGGVRIDKESKLYMKNGASIQNNKSEAGDGGGVCVYQNDTYIYMDNSSISNNYTTGKGGGVCARRDATRISMTSNSSINNNRAAGGGGGIFFYYTYCNVISSDKTASVSYNRTSGGTGGGINFDEVRLANNEGEVSGVKIAGNYAYGSGGGLRINQRWIRVVDCVIDSNSSGFFSGGGASSSKSGTGFYNCTITGNSCFDNGGGLYLEADANVENCTITGNCGRVGGGIFVDSQYDVSLKGKVVVKDNTRRSGLVLWDDLFLEDGTASTAYIKGSVSADSKIGLRTDASGDRLLAKQVSTYDEGTYFMDLDGFYISHGSDHEGDLWQRKDSSRWEVRLNGKYVGTYGTGDEVALNGASTDADQVFWHWSEENSTGLSPFSKYVHDKNNKAVTFLMPNNNVDLVADYAGYSKDIKVEVERPVAGKDLPKTVTLTYTSKGETKSFTTDQITWENSKHRKVKKATYGEKYRFYFLLDDNKTIGFTFPGPSSIANTRPIGVSLVCSDGETTPGIQDSHVDLHIDGVFRLHVFTNWFETAAPAIKSVDGASVKVTAGTSVDASAALSADSGSNVSLTGASLTSLLPSVAKANVQGDTSLGLEVDTDSEIDWPDGLISDGTVADPAGESQTYTVSIPLKSTDKATNPLDKKLDVAITVLPQGSVADPIVSLLSGTYTKSDDVMRLSDDNTLRVDAACATDGACIKYTVNGGKVEDYDPDAGIVLTCPQNDDDFFELSLWAVKDGVESDKVQASYQLDDTLQKTIQIGCKDTALYADGDAHWSDTFDVTCDLRATTVITAPDQTGKVFDHWEWDGAPEGTELANPTLTIDDFQLDLAEKITAVYVPLISTIDVGLTAPEAHKALSSDVSYVRIGTGNDGDATLDVTSYFDGSSLAWLPGASGEAEHNTSYTAALALNSSLPEGVNYELFDGATVMLNGVAVPGSLAFVADDADGARTLYVNFESTGPYEYASYTQPADVSVSFTDACAYQQDQAAGKNIDWGLPDDLTLTYACGETGIADIAWEAPAGFDPTKLEAQVLTATGKVTYPESVDSTGAPETVTVKINVAAPETSVTPEPDSSADSGTQGNGSAKQNPSSVSTTSAKSKVPATGDESSQVAIPLLVLGLASIAVCASLLVAARKRS